MTIEENRSLKIFNTFGLPVQARFFVEVDSLGDMEEVIASSEFKNYPHLILGGGSNVLLLKDFPGLVIKNNIVGIEVLNEKKEEVLLKGLSGTLWHHFVMYAVERGWGGLENLSLVPGSVGASPMQNIGAYGVELKETFVELEALELATGTIRIFTKEECKFGYRESIFKHELKDKYFILSITVRLSKHPKLRTDYGDIARVLVENGVTEPTVKDVSDAVISIRKSKLPDPKEFGNSGSFFKNPEVTREVYEKLAEQYPDMPNYPTTQGMVKIPAAWMIEQCGWKGKRVGNTGSHARQALVLINYGGATGSEIKKLADDIIASVKEKFGITLSMEVNVI